MIPDAVYRFGQAVADVIAAYPVQSVGLLAVVGFSMAVKTAYALALASKGLR